MQQCRAIVFRNRRCEQIDDPGGSVLSALSHSGLHVACVLRNLLGDSKVRIQPAALRHHNREVSGKSARIPRFEIYSDAGCCDTFLK